MGFVCKAMFKAPVDPRVTQMDVPWSHSKYISPDSAHSPPPADVIWPPMTKSPLTLMSGSTLGRVIVTPVILVAIF